MAIQSSIKLGIHKRFHRQPEIKIEAKGGFRASPAVKTPCFHHKGQGSEPGGGTKIPHATRGGQKQAELQTRRGVQRQMTPILHMSG